MLKFAYALATAPPIRQIGPHLVTERGGVGFRFRRRINLFPGLTLNLSGSGVSATVGVPGANFNVSHRGVYGTAGIPGSGFHYRTPVAKFPNPDSTGRDPGQDSFAPELAPYRLDRAGTSYKSKEGDLTSFNLKGLKVMVIDHAKQVAEANNNVVNLKHELARQRRKLIFFKIASLGIFLENYKNIISDDIADLEENISFESEISSKQAIAFELPDGSEVQASWNKLVDDFEQLAASNAIWDVSLVSEIGQLLQQTARTNAGCSYERNKLNFKIGNSTIFDTAIKVPWLENFNGAPICLYPGFLHIHQGADGFSLIDFHQIEIDLVRTRFVEEGALPTDAHVADYVWAKANRNGSPDMRFRDNYQIPVCEYAEVTIRTFTGLNEKYLISNVSAAEAFVSAFKNWQMRLKRDFRFVADEEVSPAPSQPPSYSPEKDVENTSEAPPFLPIEPSIASNRTLDEIGEQISELKMHIAAVLLADFRTNLSELQAKVLLHRGEESVLAQMAEQMPTEIADGDVLNFSIRVDYTDENGDYIPFATLQLTYVE